MAEFKPSLPYTTTAFLLEPKTKTVKGTVVKEYTTPGFNNVISCSFKTYGGTEKDVNGITAVENTAVIETWYRPDIKADCRIALEDGTEYEIINTPENINMRNQFLKMKVRALKGGA